MPPALKAANSIKKFKSRLRDQPISTIYINDNFDKWRSDFRQLVKHALEDNVSGEEVARILHPNDENYFVKKARHSGFLGTTLKILLQHMGTKPLILADLTVEMCVQFTAQDAHVRQFELVAPHDLVLRADEDTKQAAVS